MKPGVWLLSWIVLAATAPADESHSAAAAAPLALTVAQQQAVGIRAEQPQPLAEAAQIEAYGVVLDPVALVTDLGRLESTRAAADAAAADAARLAQLYRDDQRASLKALQAAQAQAVEAQAQARAAQLAFRLQWGPLATWSADARSALLEALGSGTRALMRASVPGQRAHGVVGPRAVVDVDGVSVEARVLGPLPRVDPGSQSAGWLLEIEHSPQGLGPGARAAARLQTPAAAGLLVPATALIYSAAGAFVYRERGVGAAAVQYEAVPVKPLSRVGNAWLVAGLTRADQVVVQGAGVLWSVQGIGSFSAAEEDHD